MNRPPRPHAARYGLRKRYTAVSVGVTAKRAATALFWPLLPVDRYLVNAAARRGDFCSCGWYVNPAGCCRKACRMYSGVPF